MNDSHLPNSMVQVYNQWFLTHVSFVRAVYLLLKELIADVDDYVYAFASHGCIIVFLA